MGDNPEAPVTIPQVAAALLIDETNRILLQLRDSHAATSPNKWALVGGFLEIGETARHAVAREIKEETGLSLTRPPEHWLSETVRSEHFSIRVWHMFVSKSNIDPASITVGEGVEMVLHPLETAGGLLLASSTRYWIDRFTSSGLGHRILQATLEP